MHKKIGTRYGNAWRNVGCLPLTTLLFAAFALLSIHQQPGTASAGAFQAGDTFKDCEICPEMMVVPSGSYTMGSPADEPGRYAGEDPEHAVTIAEPFAVGRFEVTFAEWDACVADGRCAQMPDDSGWGRGNRPVINVSWAEITAQYLPWLARKSGHTYRLLSEAEWEYAARAGTQLPFPWGSAMGTAQANCIGCDLSSVLHKTTPAGSFPANAFGLHDMHGNVWEWVEDFYHLSEYDGAPADGSAWIADPDVPLRVARGGSWGNQPRDIRSANRGAYEPDARGNYLGFRVARSLAP